jgi:hypothetical protein
MTCECDTLKELQSFGGYSHYESTLLSMMNNVSNGYFEILSQDQFEIVFRCRNCNQIWKLGRPDFPVTGYFHKV